MEATDIRKNWLKVIWVKIYFRLIMLKNPPLWTPYLPCRIYMKVLVHCLLMFVYNEFLKYDSSNFPSLRIFHYSVDILTWLSHDHFSCEFSKLTIPKIHLDTLGIWKKYCEPFSYGHSNKTMHWKSFYIFGNQRLV